MPNVITAYDPYFYANVALMHLRNSLGMANAVYRGYDSERRAQSQGGTVKVRKPSVFVAQSAPGSNQDLTTSEIDIALDQWMETKFTLTDADLTKSNDRIIAEHINPMAYALANDIDQKLAALYKYIPWHTLSLAQPGSTALTDITSPKKILFNNGVPRDPNMMYFMVDGLLEQGLLGLAALAQATGVGDSEGQRTMISGMIGRRLGVNIFANQNVQTHTPGTTADFALTLTGGGNPVPAGTSTVAFAAAGTGTLVAGDNFVIAGNTQRYTIQNTVTASGNAFTGVNIFPALVAAYADGAVVTLGSGSALPVGPQALMFHTNAFAFVSAPLSDMASELGAKVATVFDPVTGLSLRSRVWYVGDSSAVRVGLDVLYGVKVLDPNMACRVSVVAT